MSYYTRVQIAFEGASYFAAYSDEKILPHIIEKAEGFRGKYTNIGFDVQCLDSLGVALTGETLEIKSYAPLGPVFEEFVLYLSNAMPGTTFGTRGWGEDFSDTWTFSFCNGQQAGLPTGWGIQPRIPSTNQPMSTPTAGWLTKTNGAASGWRSIVSSGYLKAIVIALLTLIIVSAFSKLGGNG